MIELRVKIYQLKTGEHVVCYRDPVTKLRKRKKFESKVDAKAHQKKLIGEFNFKGAPAFNQTTVGELMKRHLEKFPNSRVLERKRHFLSFCQEFGEVPINKVGKTELQVWYQKIKKQYDLSDRTLMTLKSDLSAFFYYLEDEGIVANSPLKKVWFDRHAPIRRPRVTLSIEEVHKVLENSKTFSPKLLYPILFIAAYTGARRSEVLSLKRCNVDFETNLIHFRQTKNGDDRAIRMSKSLRAFLEEFLASHDYDWVIPYEDGGAVPSFIIGKRLRRFRKMFPIGKNWGPHSLRHSFAHNFLKKGGNMYQLQAILGHRRIDVTIDTYGQLAAQEIENACPYETEGETNEAR